MIKDAFSTSIKYMQIMDESGNIDEALKPNEADDELVLEMYKAMSLARALDAKALSLQRQGRLATYAPLIGEEATQIGSAIAMRKNDFAVPNFRQHGVYITRGLPLEQFFVYWKGYEDGAAIPKELNMTPVIVPVGTQMPHAAGIAFANKYKGVDSVVVVYIGDGGTSEGDFYEAINFAGVFKLPLVVVIENNQWAISVPRKMQTAAQTLAQKAVAAGIDSIQVDGNDVLAVYKAMKDAIESAKAGKPYVIECVTYRMSMHTTSDDPTKYRPDAEVDAWKQKDPIARVEKYLTSKGMLSDSVKSSIEEEHAKLIDEALEKAEQFKPNPSGMFDSVYSFLPQVLKEQKDEAEAAGFWQSSG
ncbi:pyruvate dehydrogenase (acetyl-transferring) E1 component subunit alpha [Candidatus Marsarchaeota archaeon]|nr:pyruvate dehydrogenase (acetyl-transferring) E1 component subunit alpha [Candidatus Marsarchaeota archaeon]MCL5404375.1 pyruvate dehydrogenase (acetyl-transferring) E1 component subunit alpha [Candidatus Marsarchaeota archaeon]